MKEEVAKVAEIKESICRFAGPGLAESGVHEINNLSDMTLIGSMQWKDLKDKAMVMKYKEQTFWKGLSAEEKRMVEALRLNQRIQGDM